MNPDFLSGFRKTDFSPLGSTPALVADNKILFMLSSVSGLVSISIVNAKLEPVEADFRYFSGAEANMVKSLNAVSSQNAMLINWSDNGGGKDGAVIVDEHPELLYILSRCSNVVTDSGQPVSFADETAEIRYRLMAGVGANTLRGTFECVASEGEIIENPAFLTDSFVIAGETVFPIASVGDNVGQLDSFSQQFPAELAESVLSVLLSNVSNIKIDYDNREVVRREETEDAVPTLIIEKVESDGTLYMRVCQSVGSLPPDFSDRFNLTEVVAITDDRIIVSRFRLSPYETLVEAVRTEMRNAAPSRAAFKSVFVEDNLMVIPPEVASPFLLGCLPSMLNSFRLLGVDKLKEYKILPVKPKLNIKLGSGIDFLEGDASVEIGEQTFTLGDLLAQYRRNRYVELADGNRAVIDSTYMRRLERIFNKERDKDGKVRVSFFDLPDIEELINEKARGEAFNHYRSFYEGFSGLAKSKLKLPALKGTLRAYQSEGVKWINYLRENNLNGCLADDMGLGKTIQAIAALTAVAPEAQSPSLVVMPRSLLFNWQEELRKFAPSLSVALYYGAQRDLSEAMKSQVILTTYALVRNDIEELSQHEFEYVILDESQAIKNLSAQMTRAVFMLRSRHRLALSGTPIENNLTELYSLFHFLNPAMLGTIENFNSNYVTPIQRDSDKDAIQSLRRKIFPFVLRRLKRDVLNDLPERTDTTLYVEMEPDHAAFYERRRRYFRDEVNRTIDTEGVHKARFVMFQALSELRRIASVPESMSESRIKSPKLEMLIDQVEEAVCNGHKTVIFFNFIAGVELAAEMLEKRGIGFGIMTGATADRAAVVRRFQTDTDCKVMLMTIKVGGVGLNLTAADTVFIFEPWWNKAAEEQAINRLHRIGQKNHVHSYSLITRGTIEEKILQLQQQKAQLFDDIIAADGSLSKELTEEDINFILS